MENEPAELPPENHASFWLPLVILIGLLNLPVFFLDPCSTRSDRNRDAKRTRHLMMAVLVSNTACAFLYAVRMTACGNCGATGMLVFNNRIISRGINMMFLIHRTKLVQGMSPVLSKKWFEKILPISVAVYSVIWMLISSWGHLARDTVQCVPYMDSGKLRFCWVPELSNDSTGIYIFVAVVLLPDFGIITVLLTLFVVPLYRVYRVDLGRMNENQLRQRQKLQRLLIWSVILTFTNQVTTMFWYLTEDKDSLFFWILWLVGMFDPPINVWTSWLMVTRNRHRLQKICCCQCLSRAGVNREQRSTIGISNLPSRTNSHQFLNNKSPSRSSIALPVSSLVLPPVEMSGS